MQSSIVHVFASWARAPTNATQSHPLKIHLLYIIFVISFCTYSCQNYAAKGKSIAFNQLQKCTPIVLVKKLDGSVHVLDKTKRKMAMQTLSTHFFRTYFYLSCYSYAAWLRARSLYFCSRPKRLST